MITAELTRVRRSAKDNVESYRQAWDQDNSRAAECSAIEETIDFGLSVYYLIHRLVKSWRERVYRGVETRHEADSEFFLSLSRLWLSTTTYLLKYASELEGHGYVFDAIAELRLAEVTCRKAVDAWSLPAIAKAVGLREVSLTKDEAARLRAIMLAKPIPLGGLEGVGTEAVSAGDYFKFETRPS